MLYDESEKATGFKLLTGGCIPEFIESIGKRIDFLVLDTMHICPGELLDFLVCFPYMTEKCVVVMHDIAMQFGNNTNAYATQLLLDTVTADKIIGNDKETGFSGYPNIGALIINNDTKKYIENVFSALNIPWSYMPEDIELYRDCFIRNYDRDLVDIYDMAYSNNTLILNKKSRQKVKMIGDWISLGKAISDKDIYIYGNGRVGKQLEIIFKGEGMEVFGHIVSESEEREENSLYLREIDNSLNTVIVIGTGLTLQSKIAGILEKSGVTNYISLSREVLESLLA